MLWIPICRFGTARSVRETLDRLASRHAILERQGPDPGGACRVLLGCGRPGLLEPAVDATLRRLTAETALLADALDAREDIPSGATMRVAAHAARFAQALGLDPQRLNRRGGGLARGHPIGASAAVALVRALADLWRDGVAGDLGLCAVAGAGGLGSAALLRRL